MHNESQRQKQVSKIIQKDLGEIFQLQNIGKDALVTITTVKSAPDLGLCRIYVSVFPPVKQYAVLEEIEKKSNLIRNEVGKRVRHQFRQVPNLEFFIDKTEEEAAEIEQLIDSLDIPPAPEEEDENYDNYKDEGRLNADDF